MLANNIQDLMWFSTAETSVDMNIVILFLYKKFIKFLILLIPEIDS